MKKIYFILLIIAQSGLCFADFNPGNFEIRLVAPSDPGLFRVQMRAVASVIPTTADVCSDLSFAIWWDNVANPTIVDIDVDMASSIGGQLQEAAPLAGNSSGLGAPNGLVVPVSLANVFQYPTNWVLNQWVHIANVNICSSNNCSPAGFPAGITAAHFQIQGFTGTLPNMQINSGLDYTPSNAPLPLNLVSFDAKKSGERDVYLNWTTVNEENTSHFQVQRSFDLKTWSEVGKVAAAGYSIDIRNYELNDYEVYNGIDSRLQVHYRLLMVDLDGRSKLSPIRSVLFGNSLSSGREITVYPNPSSDGLQIEWEASRVDQPTQIEFFDVKGKQVYSKEVSDLTNQEYIDFGHTSIQPGLYILRILSGTEAIEHKQIVVTQR